MKKNLCKSLLISLGLALSSCATSPPDVPACVELSPSRGGCVKVISGTVFTIDEEHPFVVDDKPYTWWQLRPMMVQLPPSSWADLKKWIIKVCRKYESMCNKEISSWDRTINNIDDALKKKQ